MDEARRHQLKPGDAPDKGASSVEYALMLAGIAALIVLIVFAFGGMVRDLNHQNCTTIAGTASPDYRCG